MKLEPPRTLNDACLFIVDCLHATAPTESEGYPLIRTPNIGKGRLTLTDVYRVSEDTYQTWTKRAVPEPGDLILAREAPAGNVAIVKEGEKVCLGQRTVHLRPDSNKVDPDFLGYFLLAPPQQGKLLAGETGATAKHVNMKDILRLELSGLPSLPAQKAAGSLLAAYDDLIENNRRRMEMLEEAARQLYREWFVRLRFPGHEHTRITNGVPEAWERKKLSDLAFITMGQSPKSQHYNEVGEGLPFHQGVTDFGERFVTHRIYSTALNRVAEAGDILCSVRAPVGRLNVTLEKIVIGRGLSALRSHDAHQSLLLQQLRAHFFKEDLIGGGAIFASVTKKEFSAQSLLDPPERLKRAFEEVTTPCDAQLRVLHLQNQQLRAARDLLLPRLMSGEIAV
jgi:type I restriction enzyme S subunit